MIRAMFNWWKLVRFIKRHRLDAICEYQILTTATEMIIVPIGNHITPKPDVQLRLNQEFPPALNIINKEPSVTIQKGSILRPKPEGVDGDALFGQGDCDLPDFIARLQLLEKHGYTRFDLTIAEQQGDNPDVPFFKVSK